MDPITLAITTALGSLGAKVINDAYVAFKTALQQKYGVDSDLLEAVDKLEKRPESAGRQATLKEEVVTAQANLDQELVNAAQQLIALVRAEQKGAAKRNVVHISESRVQGFVQDNQGQVTINFNSKPPQD